jgi:predicted HTH domain antitoxin
MKHEYMVGTRLPKELVKELETIERVEHADRSTTLRKLLTSAVEDWKLAHYARQYGERKLTLASAARNAGVSVWEYQEYLRTHRINVQYDTTDLAHDLATIKRRRKNQNG